MRERRGGGFASNILQTIVGLSREKPYSLYSVLLVLTKIF
jgi:hypothetical protein